MTNEYHATLEYGVVNKNHHVALTNDYILNEDEYAELNAWLEKEGGKHEHRYDGRYDTKHYWFEDPVAAVWFKLRWCDL